MTWKLWLDDQADDPERPARQTPEGYLTARSAQEAIKLAEEHGLPAVMDLDHDLGSSDTMEFIRALVRLYPDGPVPEYTIHSENPVGRTNITAYLESWKKTLESPIPTLHGFIRDAAILSHVHGHEITATFSITAEEWTKINTFREEHKALHKGHGGAIGGRFSYSFTPTTLFTVIRCECACGAHVDATDYSGV
jgi:hypothetical protein